MTKKSWQQAADEALIPSLPYSRVGTQAEVLQRAQEKFQHNYKMLRRLNPFYMRKCQLCQADERVTTAGTVCFHCQLYTDYPALVIADPCASCGNIYFIEAPLSPTFCATCKRQAK